MRFAARVLGFLFIFLLVFFVSKTSFAQTTNYIPQNTQVLKSVPNNLNTYSQSVLFSVLSAVGCQLAGIDPANPNQPCLGTDPQTGKIGFTKNNGGLIGFAGSMITTLYTPPAHTSDYIQYLAGNFGIAKSASAQNYSGVGLTTITPIASLWIVFRNIVYLLFVVIFMLIGVGIMLRVRIDPRTVMTIQNQIPKIIIGIILVTLSFPIAGFLIDFMWVVILVVKNILEPLTNPVPLSYNFVTPFGLSNVFGGILGVARDTAGFLGSSIFNSGFTTNNVNSLVHLSDPPPGCGILDVGCWLGGLLGNIVGAILGFIIGIAVGLIAFFVVVIALLWALFKLWFELLKSYISILIGIIFAPFWIVAGLIPGSGEKVGFGAWLRDMLGNLMAFPVAIGMFYLAAIFVRQFKAASDVFFLPPLIGPQSADFGAIIAFGILMMTPNAVKITKAAFKSKGIEGGAVGQGVGAAIGVLAAPTGRVKGALFGTDARTGQANVGTAYVGRKFGTIARGFAGGNFTRDIKDREGNITGRENLPLLRTPKVLSPITSRAARVTKAVTSRIPGLRNRGGQTPTAVTPPTVEQEPETTTERTTASVPQASDSRIITPPTRRTRTPEEIEQAKKLRES